MEKIFNGKKITIRPFSRKDIYSPKKFQDFINSLIEEDAMIKWNRKVSLKEEIDWLKNTIKDIKRHKRVFLTAENDEIVVGTVQIALNRGRQNHVGNLGVIIRKDYRGIGLGKYLMAEIIKLARKELKPKPKIIRLSVFPTNKPAIRLYKKYGFKKVALVPNQFKYKGKLYDEMIMLLTL